MNSADRLYKYDNAKAALIMLVVIGHFSEAFTEQFPFCKSIFMAIYAFHMPAFFFISGLFCRGRMRSFSELWSKTAPFLLLCLVCNFLRFLSTYIYDRSISFHIFRSPNVSWYLFALFVFFMLTYAVRNLHPGYVLAVSVLTSMITGYDNSIGSMLAIYRIAAFFPFFYLGSVCDAGKLEAVWRRKGLKAAAGAGMLAFLVICYRFPSFVYQFRKLVTGANSYYKLPFEVGPFSWSLRLGYYVAVLLILAAFLCLIPSKRIPVVSHVGTRTLPIYILHLFIVETITRHEEWLTPFMGSNLMILVLFIILSACIVLVLSLKPCAVFVDFFAKPWKKSR